MADGLFFQGAGFVLGSLESNLDGKVLLVLFFYQWKAFISFHGLESGVLGADILDVSRRVLMAHQLSFFLCLLKPKLLHYHLLHELSDVERLLFFESEFI